MKELFTYGPWWAQACMVYLLAMTAYVAIAGVYHIIKKLKH